MRVTDESWVQMRAGACEFAVRVDEAVLAIPVPAEGLLPLPRRQAGALSGVLDFRGSAVPVVALDRWLPIGEATDGARRRIVVLRAGGSLIGIEVDAVQGVRRIPSASIRRIHADASDSEDLFESVATTADGAGPMTCLLEVGRLAALASIWCDQAGIDNLPTDAVVAGNHEATRRSYGVFEIGGQRWAIPAERLSKVAVMPATELKWPGRRTCGICEFEGRKMALVDLACDPATFAVDAAPRWIAVAEHQGQFLGLTVGRCQQFVHLQPDQIIGPTDDELTAGTAAVPGLGMLRILDVDQLFAVVPEARLGMPVVTAASRTPASSRSSSGSGSGSASLPPSAPGSPRRADSHYLVFDADRRYASPIAGLLGVMALAAPEIVALCAGRRATVTWRGQSVSVVNLPPIDGRPSQEAPRLAVIVEGASEQEPCSGIAIRRLTDWLPVQAAARSGLRTNSAGDLHMITSQRTSGAASMVVVDLAQMAYLLS